MTNKILVKKVAAMVLAIIMSVTTIHNVVLAGDGDAGYVAAPLVVGAAQESAEVSSIFTVETTEYLIIGEAPFYVFGNIGINGNFLVALQGFFEDSSAVFNIADALFSEGGSFMMGPYFFPSSINYAEGKYIIEVYLYNAETFELLVQTELEIEFRRN